MFNLITSTLWTCHSLISIYCSTDNPFEGRPSSRWEVFLSRSSLVSFLVWWGLTIHQFLNKSPMYTPVEPIIVLLRLETETLCTYWTENSVFFFSLTLFSHFCPWLPDNSVDQRENQINEERIPITNLRDVRQGVRIPSHPQDPSSSIRPWSSERGQPNL